MSNRDQMNQILTWIAVIGVLIVPGLVAAGLARAGELELTYRDEQEIQTACNATKDITEKAVTLRERGMSERYVKSLVATTMAANNVPRSHRDIVNRVYEDTVTIVYSFPDEPTSFLRPWVREWCGDHLRERW